MNQAVRVGSPNGLVSGFRYIFLKFLHRWWVVLTHDDCFINLILIVISSMNYGGKLVDTHGLLCLMLTKINNWLLKFLSLAFYPYFYVCMVGLSYW